MQQTKQLDPETCWQAVEKRDAAFDGVFYYGVRSTGIYCKPSCASRQPLPAQVTYFPDQEAAQAAGYRACKRCRPNHPTPAAQVLVGEACALLEQSSERLSLGELSARLGVSASHLQRTFKAQVGLSPRQYAAAQRLERFKDQARQAADVTSAQYAAGFGSARGLYEQASAQLGMTPAVYRRGGQGMTVQYTTAPCSLGRLLVAVTERGLCAVRLDDQDRSLEASLRQEFPAARLAPYTPAKCPPGLAAWLQTIQAYLAGAPIPPDLPLDLQASAFQLRVWEALRRIPYGQTMTYAQVASAIGQPKAYRAVAQACAANPVALATPCHRVVSSDGSLGGYRWGVERKRALLEQEKLHG